MFEVDEDVTHAFNLGCDARIKGIPVTSNPYGNGEEKQLFFNWDQGWHHVQAYWGNGVHGRWFYRKLSRVRAQEQAG